MDAVSVLKQDHDTVKGLFEQFERASDTSRKQAILEQIFTELEIHTAIEEQVFYPSACREAPEVEEIVREGVEEHHVVDALMGEIRAMSPTDDQWEPKAVVLIENVRHHIEEEEGELFPKLREQLDGQRLAELGRELERAKEQQDGGVTIDLTRDELYEQAKELGIEGRSDMNKAQLAAAVDAAEQ